MEYRSLCALLNCMFSIAWLPCATVFVSRSVCGRGSVAQIKLYIYVGALQAHGTAHSSAHGTAHGTAHMAWGYTRDMGLYT